MSDNYDVKKLSDRRLADLYGAAKVQADAEDKRLAALKVELASRDKSIYRGERYDIGKVPNGRNQLDTKAIVAEMGEAWAKAHKKFSSWVEWSVIDKLAGTAPDADRAKAA